MIYFIYVMAFSDNSFCFLCFFIATRVQFQVDSAPKKIKEPEPIPLSNELFQCFIFPILVLSREDSLRGLKVDFTSIDMWTRTTQ